MLEGDLTEASPTATLLWNHVPGCTVRNGQGCLPKSEDEISDFLAWEIGRELPGVIVNREVQVSRLQTSGIGQRTDILVQVPGPSETDRILRVVLEVKGCWNGEIPEALEDQLLRRYLGRWPDSAGVFLVAWFNPAHGSKDGSWLRDPVRGNKAALTETLAERAEAASMSSQHVVRSLVLDCSMPT